MKRLLLLLLLAADAAALPVADYIATLERIDALLAANQPDAAQNEALTLKGTKNEGLTPDAKNEGLTPDSKNEGLTPDTKNEGLTREVVWAKGTFRADPFLLAAIDRGERAQLIATIAELRRASGMSAAQADRKLLEQIAADQEPPELPKGGIVPTKLNRDIPLVDRIANTISDMLSWLRDKLKKLIDWLFDLLPRRRNAAGQPTQGLHWIVWAVVGAILLIILYLAFDVLRRSRARGAAAVETSVPIGSKQDEDPLSRGATEWEKYASDLASAGRFREAIRAWYHAVLITCYALGILHFRKGRTNWEYIASLAPSLPWRPDAIELTRRFEQEWYGALHSSRDAYDACSDRARSVLDSLRGGA